MSFLRAGDADELKLTSASEVNLGDSLLESELLSFEISLKALRLQGQLDDEGELGEEEELPPLLSGVVTYARRTKSAQLNKEAIQGSTSEVIFL